MVKEKKLGLASWILIAMIVGTLAGWIFKGSFNVWGKVTTPIGDVFIRLLKMGIAPLVFFSITSGISSVADLKRLKKVGSTFIIYWIIASLLAAAAGVIWAYIIQPGVGITLAEQENFKRESVSIVQSVVNWVPDNIALSFTQNNIIQIIIFSVFLGVAVTAIPDSNPMKAPVKKFFEYGNHVIMSVIEYVMKLAPIGVLCLMANVTGSLGNDVLTGLTKMLVTQYVSYATLILIVFPFILLVIAKVNPLKHYLNIYPAMLLGFSTCSSSATLPVTMKCTHERAGVPEETVKLLAPPAATINMQACAAEMPIYAIFAAQLFGLDLSPVQIITISFLGVIMAAGVAGVPGGGIMMAAIMMETMGLPLTIVPWVAGIYRLIDMPNTMLNVTGDTVGMVTTSSLLGTLDRDKFNSLKKG